MLARTRTTASARSRAEILRAGSSPVRRAQAFSCLRGNHDIAAAARRAKLEPSPALVGDSTPMVHIEEKGRGACVVLFHGAPMSPAHMNLLAERLAQSYRTFTVHLPGYGRSAPLDPYSMERSHAEIEATLVARGCRVCHLVGFASGAYRAIAIALRGAVVPLSIAALAGAADLTDDEAERLVADARQLRNGADAERLLVDAALSPRGRENPAWVADVREWARATTTDNLVRELEALAIAPDLRPELARLDLPLLVRVGSIDAAWPSERSRRIVDVGRNVVFEEVPGVGHALLHEDLQATVDSVSRHLARPRDARGLSAQPPPRLRGSL